MYDQYRLIDLLRRNAIIDNDYSEQGSGATKAIKIIIPNCISMEEDDQYLDDCYPNFDFDFLINILEGEEG